MESKSFWTSKTLWFNLISLIITVAISVLDQQLITDPKVISIITLVITVGNTILRIFFTTQPITKPGEKPNG